MKFDYIKIRISAQQSTPCTKATEKRQIWEKYLQHFKSTKNKYLDYIKDFCKPQEKEKLNGKMGKIHKQRRDPKSK